MARIVKQIQIGNSIFQIDSKEDLPLFDQVDIIARIFLRDWSGTLIPTFELASSNGENLYISPERLIGSRGDPSSSANWYLFSQLGYAYQASGYGCGLQLYTDEPGSHTVYININHGWYSSAASRYNPFLRLTDAILILDDELPVINGSVNPVSANHAAIGWNNTEKRIRSYDNGGVTYQHGFNDRGDPSAFDWTQATLTLDGAWHDLDCSSIVPAGAKAIVFSVHVQDNLAGKGIMFRKNGNSNAINHHHIVSPIADGEGHGDLIVACDSNRIVEYLADSGVDSIDVVITGWFI